MSRINGRRRVALVGIIAGLLVAPLVPGIASATPPPATPDRATALPNTPAASGSAADSLASALAVLGKSQYADAYYGMTLEDQTTLTLYMSDTNRGSAMLNAARKRAGLSATDVKVAVQDVLFTRAELRGTREALWLAAQGWLEGFGVEIYGIAVDADGGGLTVDTNDPVRAQALIDAAITGLPGGKNIAFQQGAPVEPMTRYDDYPPYAGGVYLGPSGCTSGFGMRTSTGAEAMVTAFHCFPANATVRDGGGTIMGTINSTFPYRDAEYFRTDTWAGVFTINESYTRYKNWDYNYNGQSVCQSGYPSNQICGLVVNNDDYEYRLATHAGTITVRGVRARKCAGCVAVRKGDSGGPVWVPVSGGVQSRGIVSGGQVSLGGSPQGFESILFTETGWILQGFNGSLLIG